MAHTPEGCAAIQRDLSRLEEGAERNIRASNKVKYKALHLGRKNQLMHHYVLWSDQLEHSLAETACGSWWITSHK